MSAVEHRDIAPWSQETSASSLFSQRNWFSEMKVNEAERLIVYSQQFVDGMRTQEGVCDSGGEVLHSLPSS